MALDRPLVFFGPPAAGKGTQAKRIADLYRVPHLSTGDMLREAIARGTQMGSAVKPILERGALVPDDIVMAMVEERLSRSDCDEGCVFDGFPRTVPQAQSLDAILCRMGKQKPLVLELRVPRETLIRRIAGRRMCSIGGEVYNIYDAPPRVDQICDRDGGSLIQRPDDRPEVFEERLKAYERQTLPLEAYYRREGVLETVDGSVPMEEVTRALVSIVGRAQGRDGHL